MDGLDKKDIIKDLRNKILHLQGFRSDDAQDTPPDFGLDFMNASFPRNTFPLGAVHEFISPTASCAAATNGFVTGLLSKLMVHNRYCLWVSTKRRLFPIGMTYFGIVPDHIIFVDVEKDKDALWVMEQGLRCNALAAVVAELNDISFTESKRLQLAVEESRVTGFLHRKKIRSASTLACVSRWRIKPSASIIVDGLPGVGTPVWEVQLEKIRNGQPGSWLFSWKAGQFVLLSTPPVTKGFLPKTERYA